VHLMELAEVSVVELRATRLGGQRAQRVAKRLYELRPTHTQNGHATATLHATGTRSRHIHNGTRSAPLA
jgi:hypothetical protein